MLRLGFQKPNSSTSHINMSLNSAIQVRSAVHCVFSGHGGQTSWGGRWDFYILSYNQVWFNILPGRLFSPDNEIAILQGFCYTAVLLPSFHDYSVVMQIPLCISICSVSIMAVKGFGVAVKLTFAGNNQFTHSNTYVFGIIVTLCIVVQMNYFNKALGTFSTNVCV